MVPSISKLFSGPVSIEGPLHHKLANLAIALAQFRNTRRYIRAVGDAPNYISPVAYTDKVQCRKLFDRNPFFNVCCDKLAARDYAEAADCGLKFPEIYWVGDDPQDIPYDDLPVPYIIKPTSRSGAKYIVRDPGQVDKAEVRDLFRRWLRRPFGQAFGEWGYRDAPRRVYIEELLPAPPGMLYPDEYKFTLMSGSIAWVQYSRESESGRSATFLDENWNLLPFERWSGLKPPSERLMPIVKDAPAPEKLAQMVSIAKQLAGDLDELRVDLYCVGGEIWFSELTTYNTSGFQLFIPRHAKFETYPPRSMDVRLGGPWQLPPISIATKMRRSIFG